MPRSIVALDFGGNFGEDVLRSKLMCLALSVVMSASLAAPAASQIPGDPLPPVPAQKRRVPKPVPPSLSKDCATRIMKESPKTKIVARFSFAFHTNSLSQWAAEKAGVVIIAAPARTPGFMDRIVKHYVGCYYDPRGGVPVFRRLTASTEFPPRRTTVPGEE